MSATLYDLESVVVERGGDRILDAVSASIPDEGITVFVGPSGSGKTTLLRLCNRLEVPASGTVSFRGTDIGQLDPLELRRTAGMVFQRPTLFGGTVRDNLLVASPAAEPDQMLAALDRAELGSDFLDRKADSLSGGEAQRACVARTLIADPDVLLMDEVTSSLDAAPKRRLEDLARHLADGDMPVLWVTHDLAQARRLADHLVVVLEGRVRSDGPPDRIDGSDAEVVEFLGGQGAR